MPLYDIFCRSCRSTCERYISRSWKPDPPCDICGSPETERLVSRFAITFSGLISGSKYNDPKIPGAHRDGFLATKIRNTPDGKPQKVHIETFQQLREFAKSEGCINPTDLPTSAEATDQKKLSSAGMPGAWI